MHTAQKPGFVTWSSFITSERLADESSGLGRSKSVLNHSYELLCNVEFFTAFSGDLYNLANIQYEYSSCPCTCKTILHQYLSKNTVISIRIKTTIIHWETMQEAVRLWYIIIYIWQSQWLTLNFGQLLDNLICRANKQVTQCVHW